MDFQMWKSFDTLYDYFKDKGEDYLESWRQGEAKMIGWSLKHLNMVDDIDGYYHYLMGRWEKLPLRYIKYMDCNGKVAIVLHNKKIICMILNIYDRITNRGGEHSNIIYTRRELKEWIKADFESYKMEHPLAARFTYGENWELFTYMRNLRHLEYYTNKNPQKPWDKLYKAYYWFKHRKNIKRTNISIAPNSVGSGFHLQHRGFRLIPPFVKIGRNCEILPMVLIGKKSPTLVDFQASIGDNCYIGTGVTILTPVKIGHNVTIAAGAVVTQNVPNNVVVAGVPAKIVKYK